MNEPHMNSVITANLTGKVALITGASRGLGAYYAEVLAKNGAHVVVSGRSNSSDELNNVVAKIITQGYKATPYIIDLSDFKSFDTACTDIVAQLGQIDILINNAAISKDKGLFDISEDDWDLHMNTNLKGLFFLSQAIAKQMKTQNSGGCIVNIAAVNGQKVRKNCITFGVSKAAVVHLTKSMAYELIEHKIRVNGISLGFIQSTPELKDWMEQDPKAQDYINQIPVKRGGTPEDLEGPILLLVSDASSYMYGAVLNVDGGFAIDVFMNVDQSIKHL